MKKKILVVDDEDDILHFLELVLKEKGYDVVTASSGHEALTTAQIEKPNLVLLDIMMPQMDGFTVCAELRRRGNQVPVLMLTAKGQVRDRVRGLDEGADDYLTKPFSTDELLARVRALLRRFERRSACASSLALGEFEVDFQAQTATLSGQPVRLTAKEMAMLQLMAEVNGAPVSRERFLDAVWGYGAFPTTRTVDNHIASLRAKIEPSPEAPRWILTVHGVGYRLVAPDFAKP